MNPLKKDLNSLILSYLYAGFTSSEYRIQMRPRRIIHDVNKPVLMQFVLFMRKLDKSLSTSLLIRIKSILMIDIHKNVIRY